MAVVATLVLVAVAAGLAARLLLSLLAFRRLELAIPGPSSSAWASLPLIGSLPLVAGLTEDTAMAKFLEICAAHPPGQLFRLSFFGKLVAVVSDPDHLAELYRRQDLAEKDPTFYKFFEPLDRGLLTLNGAQWLAHRRLIQPAFRRSVLDSFMPVFCDEALGFAHSVRPGVEVDLAEGLKRMAVRSFYRTSAEGRDAAEAERAMPVIKAFVDSVSHSFNHRAMHPWLWSGLVFGLTALARLKRRLQAGFDDFSIASIASRRTHLLERRRAAEGEGCAPARTLLDVMLLGRREGCAMPPLSDEEVLGEFQIFYLAAIDTSVSATSWALKTLSLRPDVQERLRQEVEDVLGPGPVNSISAEELNRLEYTERVLQETLRLLPAVPFVARGVRSQTEFAGHTLPAGSSLIVNLLAVHRDPRHWPEPRRFDPDRFLAERSQGRHRYAYLPFSTGPRNCIGGRYAMMTMKTLLAVLVSRYRVDPVADGHTDPADFPMVAHIASKLVGGTRVVFTPRDACTAV